MLEHSPPYLLHLIPPTTTPPSHHHSSTQLPLLSHSHLHHSLHHTTTTSTSSVSFSCLLHITAATLSSPAGDRCTSLFVFGGDEGRDGDDGHSGDDGRRCESCAMFLSLTTPLLLPSLLTSTRSSTSPPLPSITVTHSTILSSTAAALLAATPSSTSPLLPSFTHFIIISITLCLLSAPSSLYHLVCRLPV